MLTDLCQLPTHDPSAIDVRSLRVGMFVDDGLVRPSKAVARAIDQIGDGVLGLPRAQEVAVHRVRHPVIAGGSVRSDDRLREHLAPEDAARRHRVRG